MTQVFRSLELQWQGKSYTLSPSLDLLRRVDGELKRYDRQNGATQLALALLRGGALRCLQGLRGRRLALSLRA
jgi:hypothetical protein